jgi:antitoxin component of RelBE/YafQ-DinJ toxin-antitoxin module
VNLTLSIDEDIVRDARRAAEAMGLSLNEAVRRYLADLAGQRSLEEDLAEFRELSMNTGGHSNGWVFNREEIHERP